MTDDERMTILAKLRSDFSSAQRKCLMVKKSIAKIIAECPHNRQKRQADPSGGHDHAYTCLVCGKEW
jgi:hypothetical protein